MTKLWPKYVCPHFLSREFIKWYNLQEHLYYIQTDHDQGEAQYALTSGAGNIILKCIRHNGS